MSQPQHGYLWSSMGFPFIRININITNTCWEAPYTLGPPPHSPFPPQTAEIFECPTSHPPRQKVLLRESSTPALCSTPPSISPGFSEFNLYLYYVGHARCQDSGPCKIHVKDKTLDMCDLTSLDLGGLKYLVSCSKERSRYQLRHTRICREGPENGGMGFFILWKYLKGVQI